MRPELHDIERIDQYLDGSMPAAEKILFEQELTVSPALQEAVETQSLLATAVSRKALLAQVQFHAPPRTPASSGSVGILSKFKWPIILSGVVVASLFTWFSTRHKERKATKEATEMVAEVRNDSNNNANDDSAYNPVTASEMSDTTTSEGDNIARGVDFTYQPARRTVVESRPQRTIGGLETWVSPEVQRVLINPNKEELVECRDGSVVFIPKNTFVDSNGEIVKETVTLEIVEALTYDKMVMYNLATMNGKNALVSEGMIYIQPKRGTEELQFAPGKSIQIEIPTANYNSEMLAWKGVPTGDGNINWEDPKAIENFLTTVPMASLDFLPNGFREEVQSTMPFKNHKQSSKELEDSLYYALSSFNTSSSSNQWNSIEINENGEIVKAIVTTPQKSTVGMKTPSTTGQYNLSVNFDNLPKNQKFKVQVNQGKFEATSDIDNNHATINYTNLAVANVRVYSNQCEIVFNNLNLARDMALTLDCKSIDCDGAVLNGNNGTQVPEVKWDKCYLNPSSVRAIYDEKFASTFIATPEFQERLQALHRMPNAQTYLDLYLQNLDKNLHEIDAQIAQKARGTDRQRFLDFASQKHTNVRNTGQDFALLRNYYATQQDKMHRASQQRQDLYAKKNATELAEIQNQFNKMQLDFAKKKAAINDDFDQMVNAPKGKNPRSNENIGMVISPIVTGLIPNNPRPVVGQQQSYSVSWNAPGWMNIDAYLHELSNGQIVVPILASEGNPRGKVYQSINSLKTLIPLNYLKTGYEAHFPKNPSSDIYKKSMCLSIERLEGNRFHLASTTFNPYSSESVSLDGGRDYSESELKAVLEVLHPGSDQITAQLERENVAIQAELERRKRAEELAKRRKEQMDVLDEQRIEAQKELDATKNAIVKRQTMEREYMQHLENAINPCHVNYGVSTQTSPKIVSSPDVEASFPGGLYALNAFVLKSIQYPEQAIAQNLSGKIYVKMVIGTDGTPMNPTVQNPNTTNAILEQEALRIVGMMPKWTPAQNKGAAVTSSVSFPISFTLN